MGLAQVPGSGTVEWPESLEQGRLVTGKLGLPGGLNLVLYSIYLRHGEGWSGANRATVARLGEHQATHAMQWIAGGDFQMNPAELTAGGLGEMVSHRIASAGKPTCINKHPEEIDYFLLSGEVGQVSTTVQVKAEAGTRPHRPVELQFDSPLARAKVRRFVYPLA